MIDAAEYRQAFFLQQRFDALEGFGNRIRATQVLHSIIWGWRHNRPPAWREILTDAVRRAAAKTQLHEHELAALPGRLRRDAQATRRMKSEARKQRSKCFT